MLYLLRFSVGVLLTSALLLGLLSSSFVVAVIVFSRKYKSAGNLLLLQLVALDLLLALLGITLSVPSLFQGKWLITHPLSTNDSSFDTMNITDAQPTTVHGNILGKNFTPHWLYEEDHLPVSNITLIDEVIMFPDNNTQTKPQITSDKNASEQEHHQIQHYLYKFSTESVDIVGKMDSDSNGSRRIRSRTDPDPCIDRLTSSSELSSESPETSNPIKGQKISSIYFYGVTLINASSADDGTLCRLHGATLSLLSLTSVWIVVGLHCDKYCAIASPLRYNQIVTRRRIALFSSIVWITSFALNLLVSFLAPSFIFIGGVCLPVWHGFGQVIYTLCMAFTLILSPSVVFLWVNVKILLIARQHQHRIFSAIFEVMMSAQATVTQQRNPFDMPKIKQKSAWTIFEQMISFAVCYIPVFLYMFLDCVMMYPLNDFFALVMVGTLLLAPLVNTFLYGIKSATVKEVIRNYLRKKISRTAMKCEIQARIPSNQNSRRPSISSTFGFPALQKSLQRRMSSYLSADNLQDIDLRELVRRSSDLSWHPLEDGSPTSSMLKQPLDINFSGEWTQDTAPNSSPYLAVPSFDKGRTYVRSNTQIHHLMSSSSVDSEETSSTKEPATEELLGTAFELSPPLQKKQDSSAALDDQYNSSNMCLSTSDDELPMSNGNVSSMLSVSMPYYRRESSGISSVASEDTQVITPLLCRAYMAPWPKIEPSTTNSPYIIRTLESLMSVGLCQSRLLKSGSIWRGNSFEKRSKVGMMRQDSLLSDSAHEQIDIELTTNISNVDPLQCEQTIIQVEDTELETSLQCIPQV